MHNYQVLFRYDFKAFNNGNYLPGCHEKKRAILVILNVYTTLYLQFFPIRAIYQ